jgi:hypothetical protein
MQKQTHCEHRSSKVKNKPTSGFLRKINDLDLQHYRRYVGNCITYVIAARAMDLSMPPLKLKKTVAQMLAEANAEIETIPAADAIKLKEDPNILLVDIRDIRELDRDGRIAGALHAPRGMLEFWVDPATPYHREVFASGKKFLFF